MAAVKGGEWTREKLPEGIVRGMQRKAQRLGWGQRKLEEELATIVKAHNERYRVVAVQEDGRELVAEELDGRFLAQFSARERRVIGAMLRLRPEERSRIVAAFGKGGAPKYPWTVKRPGH